MTAGSSIPILRAENITKKFRGIFALKNVSFNLYPGEIHALCGENGAGKSTLIKLLSGIHAHGSYEGNLYIHEKPAKFSGIADAQKSRIAVIYQELALVPEMTVAENIFLGSEPAHLRFIDSLEMYRETKRILSHFKLAIDPFSKIKNLGIGQQQLIEIVKALRKNSQILILDEPTAALSEKEIRILLATLKDLRKRGIACIYISHKLDEIFEIADRITVLRDGESIATKIIEDTDKKEVIHFMVGREIKDLYPRSTCERGKAILYVKNLTVSDPRNGKIALKDISFDLHAGEILGIGGLMGAGRTELLTHLFGVWGKRNAGSITLEGKELLGITPQEAIRLGMVLVTEDRRRYGLILEQSVGFNLSLSVLAELTSRNFIDFYREHAANKRQFASLGIKAPSLDSQAIGLSGGNQQKIVIGKALMTQPKIIFLDEPTRGIDVGAKQEVYQIINELTKAGKAVVLVSSELSELIGMSDRILMLHQGSVGGYFSKEKASQESLMAAAMGQKEMELAAV